MFAFIYTAGISNYWRHHDPGGILGLCEAIFYLCPTLSSERIVGVSERIVGVSERIVGLSERIVGVSERIVGLSERIVGVPGE
jgi:hypothetical protein